MNEKLIESMTGQFNKVVETLGKGPDLPGQEQVKALLQSSFAKMDLVTREEFEAQAAVLARTRQKLEALEAQFEKLEAQLTEKQGEE